MKDFSFWEEYEGAAEGSGRSEKIWLINPDTSQTGLFKFKKDIATTDHASECIAYDLARLIGIPCARFEVGTYKGREGSMSYNIVSHKEETLIEGVYCISMQYGHFDAEILADLKTGDRYSLEMIKMALEPFGLFDEFLPILIFDFLIGNTDRHQSNWALIMKDKKMQLSPLYDNSSSLCAYVAETKIDQYLGNDLMLWKSLVDTKSKSVIRITCQDRKQPTHLEVVKYMKKNYYGQTIDIVKRVEALVTEETISAIVDKYKEVLSVKKSKLILKYLLAKAQLLREIYEGGTL
ncbi:MAG: hypothetical protein HDR01_16005 [Lachnospiraceae bacterium]|nr:hypothetical protein [Lachnospiraceae bacterium]